MTSPLVKRLRAIADEFYEMCGDIHVPLREAADRIEALEAAAAQPLPEIGLYEAIAHGDDIHRAWLKEALENWFAGEPVPPPRSAAAQPSREAELVKALEDIALLDEADGHELKARHAFEAVAIATKTLGKHPSTITAERFARAALAKARGAP